MSSDFCEGKYTSEAIEDMIKDSPFDEIYSPDGYNELDRERLMGPFHFWQDIRSGFFNSQLKGKECIKCGKIISL